ncbi:MAG: hypothetical protein MJE68_34005, partial [Proteobacteria bacterium]|nr:hypothetical protein [Pseudomonadota bacterium]
ERERQRGEKEEVGRDNNYEQYQGLIGVYKALKIDNISPSSTTLYCINKVTTFLEAFHKSTYPSPV